MAAVPYVRARYGCVKLLGGRYDYRVRALHRSPRTPPGAFLLSRRTAALGALALFGVSLNIRVTDCAYDNPAVMYFSLAYSLL